MERRFTPALWTCVVMDLIGCASYTVPVLGEVSDVIWAPFLLSYSTECLAVVWALSEVFSTSWKNYFLVWILSQHLH